MGEGRGLGREDGVKWAWVKWYGFSAKLGWPWEFVVCVLVSIILAGPGGLWFVVCVLF